MTIEERHQLVRRRRSCIRLGASPEVVERLGLDELVEFEQDLLNFLQREAPRPGRF